MNKPILAFLLLLMAFGCFSQQLHQPFGADGPSDGVVPNNGYAWGPSYVPWDQAKMVYCLHDKNTGKPIANTAYNLSVYTTRTSGYHTHETEFTARPGPVFLDPTFGVTGVDGCGQMFQVQFDGFAGWVTFCASTVSGAGNTCINNFLWNGRQSAPGSNLIVTFQPYPTNTLVNKPESFHIDSRHKSGGFSRYMGRQYIPTYNQMSLNYRSYAIAYGITDTAEMTRCSLPYGGGSDNDGPDFAPNPAYGGNFSTRITEFHAEGDACDFGNPGYPAGSQYQQLGVFLVAAGHDATCTVGKYSPEGELQSDPIAFWLAKDKMHFTCAPTIAGIKPPGGRR